MPRNKCSECPEGMYAVNKYGPGYICKYDLDIYGGYKPRIFHGKTAPRSCVLIAAKKELANKTRR